MKKILTITIMIMLTTPPQGVFILRSSDMASMQKSEEGCLRPIAKKYADADVASDMDDSKKSVLDIASDQLDHIARKLGLSADIVALLREPEEEFEVMAKIIRDDGITEYAAPFIRVRQSTARGVAKGGWRFGKTASRADAKGLGMLMPPKSAGMGLPMGGGKGVAQVDKKALNLNEIARLTKDGIWQMMEQYDALGEDKDIPAPDSETGKTIMAYMTEAYLAWRLINGTFKNKEAARLLLETPEIAEALEFYKDDHNKRIRKKPMPDTRTPILKLACKLVDEMGFVIPELAAFTGKPLDRGGAKGREEAAGLGGYFTEVAAIEHYSQEEGPFKDKKGVDGVSHVLRGYGSVGREYAKVCYEKGGTFLAIANIGSAIKYVGSDRKGIDIEKLDQFIRQERLKVYTAMLEENPEMDETDKADLWETMQKMEIDLAEYKQDGVVPLEQGEEIIDVEADVLVEAATHCTIHALNADRVKQAMLLELGNATTTRKADVILAKKGVIIIPSGLSSGGAVTVSMYEIKQNLTGQKWPLELTYARLEERMRAAVDNMFKIIAEHPLENLSNRDAYWILAQKRLLDAMEARMWRRQDPLLGKLIAHRSALLRSIYTPVETDDEIWKLYMSGPAALQEAIDAEEDARTERLLSIVNRMISHFDDTEDGQGAIKLCLVGGPMGFKVQATRHMIDILERNHNRRGVHYYLDLEGNPEKLIPLLRGGLVRGVKIINQKTYAIEEIEMQLSPGDILIVEGDFALANETLDSLPEDVPRFTIAADIAPCFAVTIEDTRHIMLTNDDFTILRNLLINSLEKPGETTPFQLLAHALRHRRTAIDKIYTTFRNRATQIYNTYYPFELLFMRNAAIPLLEQAQEAASEILEGGEKRSPTGYRQVQRVYDMAESLKKILETMPDIDRLSDQLYLPDTVGIRQVLPADVYRQRYVPPRPDSLPKTHTHKDAIESAA